MSGGSEDEMNDVSADGSGGFVVVVVVILCRCVVFGLFLQC